MMGRRDGGGAISPLPCRGIRRYRVKDRTCTHVREVVIETVGLIPRSVSYWY